MRTSSRENVPGIQHGRKTLWAKIMILVSFMKWLATFIRFTEEEQEQAGIHIEHQGEE